MITSSVLSYVHSEGTYGGYWLVNQAHVADLDTNRGTHDVGRRTIFFYARFGP